MSGTLKHEVRGSVSEDIKKEVSRIGDIAKTLQSDEPISPEKTSDLFV